jgi:hypothetical protein
MLRYLALHVRPRAAAASRAGAAPHAPLRPLLLALLLGACAQQGAETAATTAAVVAPPTDPVVAFAAQAAPGAQSSILLADGRPASVRIARSYVSAGGRECRDVLVGTGTLQRSQLVCKTEAGGWEAARPLLRGGGVGR